MEFMEVYHFLPPQAGNIIIPPAEIVAKSGADYDIDKLTTFMTNLDENGVVKKPEYKTYADFKNQYEFMKSAGLSDGEIEMFFEQQKAGVENELIQSMKGILELPDNYASLITPNSNYILEPLAAELAKYVMKYDPFANKMTEANLTPEGKKTISPTRVLESLYNVYKHESNIVGKRTLGLGAIENTFNVIFNSLGMYMPNKYVHTVGQKNQEREAHLWLKHHKMNIDGEEHISMSNIYDVNNEYKVADVLAQMINGWVDVEKDPWIFFIQGNYETAPTLLYLLKTGVPIKEAVYFVSNPLVREYIQEKTLGKSAFSEVLGKKPERKSEVSKEAAGRVIRKYFFANELKMGSNSFQRYNKAVELADKYFENRKEKTFTESEMLNLIENFKKNDGELTEKEADLAKVMFLHFLEIEDQITGVTGFKMASNPDTATKSTGSEVELSEASIEQLYEETKIPKGLLDKMLKDSVISSFFNGSMALAVIRPLFKLRYNKYISEYIIENSPKFRVGSTMTLGEGKIDAFITMFRNDLINMIFQNAVRKYKLKDTYMSYTIKKEIPTALASDIKSRGAFVKANKDGTKFMYIDEKTLREEFESEAWAIGSEEDNSYENRNMYALDPRTFLQNGKLNFELYMKFVAEREFLRSEYPINEMVNKSWFRKEGLDLFEANPEVDGGTLGRFVYERYITNKALDNVYNYYHMFIDKNNSLGSRFTKFKVEYKNSLLQQYDVLDVLKLDTDKNRSIFNIYLADKDINTDRANVYTMNLKNLSDRSVMKIADKDENDRISDMFALMSNFAFLQTGLNKSKLSFTNIVDYTSFLNIMKSESEIFTKALEKNAGPILDDFYTEFMYVNSSYNRDRFRFKDYLNDMDFENPESIEATQPTIERKTYSGKVTNLESNQIFVFGSNPLGINGNPSKGTGGAALVAYKIAGVKQGEKMDNRLSDSGKAWGITTVTGPGKKKSKTPQEITEGVKKLYEYAKENPTKEFLISDYSGTNLNGYTGQEMADMFAEAGPAPDNIIFNKDFAKLLPAISSQIDIEDTPYELEETDRTNIFQYQDKLGDKEFYKGLVDNNTDVVFIRNNVNDSYKNPKKNFKGQQELDKFADNMTMNITTSLTKLNDNFAKLPKSAYRDVERLWEEEIAHIKSINDGKSKLTKIALPTTGFGDPALMPQELFVYLSRRLFDEFGYVNPGSVMFNEVNKITTEAEGLTDQEILDQLDLEEDPFKNCE
jgi:hypothetical protein